MKFIGKLTKWRNLILSFERLSFFFCCYCSSSFTLYAFLCSCSYIIISIDSNGIQCISLPDIGFFCNKSNALEWNTKLCHCGWVAKSKMWPANTHKSIANCWFSCLKNGKCQMLPNNFLRILATNDRSRITIEFVISSIAICANSIPHAIHFLCAIGTAMLKFHCFNKMIFRWAHSIDDFHLMIDSHKFSIAVVALFQHN